MVEMIFQQKVGRTNTSSYKNVETRVQYVYLSISSPDYAIQSVFYIGAVEDLKETKDTRV